MRNSRVPRRSRYGLAAATLLPVLAATLVPMPVRPDAVTTCVLCGDRAVADALLNLLLLLPFGATLGWAGAGAAAVAAAGFGVSLLIEVAQLWIPGRFSSAADVVMNGTGAMAGLLLFRSARRLGRARRHRLAPVVGLLPAPLVLTLAGVLLQPSLLAGEYHAEWTPDRPGREAFTGVLTAVSVGGVAVPPGPLGEAGPAVRRALREGAAIRIAGTHGAAVQGRARIFSIEADGPHLMTLVAVGDALHLHRYTRASWLRLSTPALRWPRAMAAEPGSAMAIEIGREARRYCLRSGDRTDCGAAYTPGSTWRLLMDPAWLGDGGRAAIDALWLLLLALPAGLLAPRMRRGRAICAAAAGILTAAGLAALPVLHVPLVTAPLLAAGFLAGVLLREGGEQALRRERLRAA
jgi:VanZ family protein